MDDDKSVTFVSDDYALLHQEESVLDPTDLKCLEEANASKVISSAEAFEQMEREQPEIKRITTEGSAEPLVPIISEGAQVDQTNLKDIIKLAGETDTLLNKMIRNTMPRKIAEDIRALRVEEPHHSWRAIARACHYTNEHWTWEPPSNQVAGMVLCKHAAEHFGEDYREEPWN